ncbi:MAG: hypothetical protein HXK26_00565 [Lancefieldella rimae]|jgi:hypothetical protein|uniref:Uncharacterized protein n=1 Tax=Lancefieldella rimae TaxID=1383 RepID=A0A930YP18_9ACTN|nr:hypothetical protein [Lancefieldella rimae]
MFNVLNMTPHDVSVVTPSSTFKDRSGRTYLKKDLSIDTPGVVVCSFQPYSKPLSVSNVGVATYVDGVPFFLPPAAATGNTIIDNNDHYAMEQADVIIVSQRCANLINAQWPYMNAVGTIFSMDWVLLDKCYTPYDLVYSNHKPIGALGLQKVITHLTLGYYAQAINDLQRPRQVSIPGLCCACEELTRTPEFQRKMLRQEDSLKIANRYIKHRGYREYPELS